MKKNIALIFAGLLVSGVSMKTEAINLPAIIGGAVVLGGSATSGFCLKPATDEVVSTTQFYANEALTGLSVGAVATTATALYLGADAPIYQAGFVAMSAYFGARAASSDKINDLLNQKLLNKLAGIIVDQNDEKESGSTVRGLLGAAVGGSASFALTTMLTNMAKGSGN